MKLFLPQLPEMEVVEMMHSYSKTGKSMSSGLDLSLESQSSTANIKIPLSEIDLQFDKWYKEDQVLSGVLNVRVTKQKNVDFKLKLKTWSLRDNDRKRIKKGVVDKSA